MIASMPQAPNPRRRPTIGEVAFAMLAFICASAQGAQYTLDPDHSFVTFEVLHFGTSTIRGRFGPLTGQVTMDTSAGTGELGMTIDTAAVDTGLNVFNARLRQPDLLSAEAFPKAWFVAKRFTYADGKLAEVRGEFTFRGVSRPLSLTAVRFACRDDAHWQREVCGGDFEAELIREDFGMKYGLPLIGGKVRLKVQVEGVRD